MKTTEAYRKGHSPFSDDEEEKKFIDDIGYATVRGWISSRMQWNTIHGIPWKRCDVLGRGGFGSVYLGMRQDKKLFAVKSVKMEYPPTMKTSSNIDMQLSEIKMMRLMRSKYIVRCLGCGRSNGENGMDGEETLDVFLEYVVRGSLKHVAKTRKKPFEETPYIRQYTYDILKALQYMKMKRVVHGDIKMANLLLSDDCVKLADWGGAKQLTRNNLRSLLIGTTGFKSPEVEENSHQAYPSDIFSLGCTVIEMITGSKPNKIPEMVKKPPPKSVDAERRVPEIPNNVSLECKDFLEQCICKRPRDRWTAAELLHHPFITKRDKTSTLPYDMTLPTLIGTSLLQPPRRIRPEPRDKPMTKRVHKHLTGVSKSWIMPNLMQCKADAPLPYQPAPLNRRTAPSAEPDPLPSFSPDLMITIGSKLLNELVQEFLGEEPGEKLFSEETMKKIFNEEAESKKSTSPESVKQRRQKKKIETEPAEVDDARDNLNRVQFNPVVGVKEFNDSLFQSASLMQEFNDLIYAEAKRAAQQPIPEDEAYDEGDAAGGLFPSDPSVAWHPKRRKTFAMGCAYGEAVDAVTPVTRTTKKK